MSFTRRKSHPAAERDSVLACTETTSDAIAPCVRELIERMTFDFWRKAARRPGPC